MSANEKLTAEVFGSTNAVQPIFTEYLSADTESFSIGSSERRSEHGSKVTASFANCVSFGGFDDPSVIRLIQDYGSETHAEISRVLTQNNFSRLLTGAYAFINKQKFEESDSYRPAELENEMQSSRKKLIVFLRYLQVLDEILESYGNILATHKIFQDTEDQRYNISLVSDALKELKVSCILQGDVLQKKDAEHGHRYADEYNDGEGSSELFSMQTEANIAEKYGISNTPQTSRNSNIFQTFVEYVEDTSLREAIPALLATGTLMDYCERAKNRDLNRAGVYPLVEEGEEGLRFEFTEIHNPVLAWVDKDEHSHRESKQSITFGNVALGQIDPQTGKRTTIVVMPGPNMAGKTTFMKAIGYCLHLGRMGRKVPCSTATMTLPDGIIHNFNVQDDVRQQLSTFKAQLANTHHFLQTATVNSLGLFDELYNGTSIDYQLALAWAFLERCSERELRVILTTHNRHIELFSDPDGYNRIKGIFAESHLPIASSGAHGSKTLSIGADHQLQDGSQRDSKALVIAKEVFSKDPAFIERAEQILRHIRGLE